jgi:hypothetical protein
MSFAIGVYLGSLHVLEQAQLGHFPVPAGALAEDGVHLVRRLVVVRQLLALRAAHVKHLARDLQLGHPARRHVDALLAHLLRWEHPYQLPVGFVHVQFRAESHTGKRRMRARGQLKGGPQQRKAHLDRFVVRLGAVRLQVGRGGRRRRRREEEGGSP